MISTAFIALLVLLGQGIVQADLTSSATFASATAAHSPRGCYLEASLPSAMPTSNLEGQGGFMGSSLLTGASSTVTCSPWNTTALSCQQPQSNPTAGPSPQFRNTSASSWLTNSGVPSLTFDHGTPPGVSPTVSPFSYANSAMQPSVQIFSPIALFVIGLMRLDVLI